MVDRLSEQDGNQEEPKVKRNPLLDVQALRDREDWLRVKSRMFKESWTIFTERVNQDEETPAF